MHIIYHCFGGAHSSVVTAWIHLGLLSDNDYPNRKSILSLPYFDQATQDDHGHLRYLGDDQEGNRIYIIGRRSLKKHFPVLVKSLAGLLGIPSKEILMVDTVSCVNWMMMLGGYTSRRLGWVGFGRPLVLKGTQRAFYNFVNLVRDTKAKARGGNII